ncbi:unnamed protein product [Adineta ricciae]|uniref:Uncharacterized protein n=1 Tax=Adineta ricciae TaxID=249248 RepID=A0A815A3Q2_ADIRI|nr:unnamed protein product [Adineta ricciae]
MMENVRFYIYKKKAEKKPERVYFGDVRLLSSPRSISANVNLPKLFPYSVPAYAKVSYDLFGLQYHAE